LNQISNLEGFQILKNTLTRPNPPVSGPESLLTVPTGSQARTCETCTQSPPTARRCPLHRLPPVAAVPCGPRVLILPVCGQRRSTPRISLLPRLNSAHSLPCQSTIVAMEFPVDDRPTAPPSRFCLYRVASPSPDTFGELPPPSPHPHPPPNAPNRDPLLVGLLLSHSSPTGFDQRATVR
jgi:hypothetical protein